MENNIKKPKNVYHPPSLQKLGKISELTKGRSSGGADTEPHDKTKQGNGLITGESVDPGDPLSNDLFTP